MYNTFNQKIILPISDIIFNRNISYYLKFLLKSQYWSKNKIETYQNGQLQKLVHHAYENVPYYTKLFDNLRLKPSAIKSKNDLRKLPLLTKKIIRENFPAKIVAKNINPNSYYNINSSGSTGEPLKYIISKNAYSFNIASNLRGLSWGGYKLGSKILKISMNPRSTHEKKVQDFINRTKYVSAKNIDDWQIQNIYEILMKYKPYLIYSYPQPLAMVAKYINDCKVEKIKIPMVNTSATNLISSDRKIIEKVFDTKIFDSYSCEGSPVIFECNTHECYHIAMEYAITELIKDTQYIKPGEIGDHITTDLHNYAMPFIRYDTQDILELANEHCACGKQLMCISKVHGRYSDIIITPDGKRFLVEHFVEYFEYENSITQFQVYQEDYRLLVFRLIVNNQFKSSDKERIISHWKKITSGKMDVRINIVDSLESFRSGKRRIIVKSEHVV